MAVAEASLRISIDSISSGFNTFPIEVSSGKPSTTYRGALLWVTELLPRITMLRSLPGWPSLLVACTPATRPARASSKFDTGAFCMSSTSTLATAPVRSLRVVVPYPTTTTSLRRLVLGRIRIVFSLAEEAVTVAVS